MNFTVIASSLADLSGCQAAGLSDFVGPDRRAAWTGRYPASIGSSDEAARNRQPP
jgi:hypothetical protein